MTQAGAARQSGPVFCYSDHAVVNARQLMDLLDDEASVVRSS